MSQEDLIKVRDMVKKQIEEAKEKIRKSIKQLEILEREVAALESKIGK